ncbi:MAG: hypothetical protein QXL54_03430 [Candidatus Bathyarchaeia archaeon]
MSEKKQKREAPSHVELSLPDDWGFVLEPAKIEIGSGYAVSLTYDEEGNPIVDVKTYGEVDSAKIKRDIERLYPNAQIRHINEEPTVTIVKKSKRKRKTEK